MKTYQFESVVDENGVIVLPKNMRKLLKHRVKLTVVDMEPMSGSPVRLLSGITQKYAAVDEEDLDVAGIYEMRERKLLIAGPNPDS